MKKLIQYGKYFTMAAVCLAYLAGCTERDIQEKPGEGYVKINLDWGTHTPPAATGYYFYDKNCVNAGIYREGTADGFEGYLPCDTYNVIIFNTDMTGAEPMCVGGYEDDCVAAMAATRTAPAQVLHVGNVFGAGIEELVVPTM